VGPIRTVDQQVNSLLLYHASRHFLMPLSYHAKYCGPPGSSVFGFYFESWISSNQKRIPVGTTPFLTYGGRTIFSDDADESAN
jgi:hypothetical protein